MRSLRLKHNLFIYRSLYLGLAVLLGVAIFSLASHLHNDNYTTIKTWENIYLTYKDRYEYYRYDGRSILASLEDTFKNDTVKATPQIQTTISVPVLLYHRIATDNNPYNVTPANFKDQMFALKKAGYTPVTIYDYVDFLDGTKRLPTKSFLITFDDGTKDSYYQAQPILKALGFHATMFVITRYSIDNPAGSHYYLSSIELKQMAASGVWDLQPHTRDGHTYYPISPTNNKGEFYPDKLWLASKNRLETDQEYANRVFNDMQNSKLSVQKLIHKPVVAFAFPFGDTGEDNSSNYSGAYPTLTNDVSQLFKTAMVQAYGGRGRSQNYFGSKSIYSYRMEMDASWPKSTNQLLDYLSTGSAKSLPYKDNLSSNNGWLDGYGQVSINNNALNLSSTTGEEGSSALLDGTSNWSDYQMTADATLISGTSYDLTARNQGSTYRIGCDFSTNYISVERQVENQTTSLIEGNYDLPIMNMTENVGIRVRGNQVQCLVNGAIMLQVNDPSLPLKGGPGFTVWDPNKPAIAKFTNIDVEPMPNSVSTKA